MNVLSDLKLSDCKSVFNYEDGMYSRIPRKVGFHWDDVAKKVTAIFFAQERGKWVAFATLDESKITVETTSSSRRREISVQRRNGDESVPFPADQCLKDISPEKKTFYLETIGEEGGREVDMKVLPPEHEEDQYERYVSLMISDPR